MSERLNHPKLLEMRGITKTFPGVKALDNVNFNLNRGEVHILLGENGAGKSTLMKILSGAYQPDSGEIRIQGLPVELKNPKTARDLGIRIIYQELHLIPHLSVSANMFLGQEFEKRFGFLNRQKIKRKSGEILKDLGLHISPAALVKSLSMAEQQMVEVAKALSFEAKVLIMDEPTSALTENEIVILFQTIRRIKEKGVGVIYISHRLEEIFQIGGRVTVLRDGKKQATFTLSQVDKNQLIKAMVNRELKEQFPRVKTPVGKTILEIQNLFRQEALRNISFHLKQGEILGISGLMGAGRTELARAIFGADRIDEGKILVKGIRQTIKSPRDAVKAGIGFLTEDRKQSGLILQLSVKDNISLPNLSYLTQAGLLSSRKEKSLAGKYISELRIKTPGFFQKVNFLSGGNQQKVVLAKWLACHIDILIFDEPTRGIDVAAKVEIYKLMNKMTASGVGIIMISSELPEILGMSDRILVMREGEIRREFTAEEATQEKILATALGEVA